MKFFFGSAENIKKERNHGIDLLEKGLNRQLPDYWFFNNIISGDIPCIGQLMSRKFAKIRLVFRLSFLLNLRLRFFYTRLTRSCREKWVFKIEVNKHYKSHFLSLSAYLASIARNITGNIVIELSAKRIPMRDLVRRYPAGNYHERWVWKLKKTVTNCNSSPVIFLFFWCKT